ncbi:N-acetylmuramoyl-L-alanine amidase [Sporichthya sp.]|uniref:peptidoglycan recognition protein family protein n=1 Tax=Sporichthya sp. TaxID=65475 RepID=UPI001806550A|nr:N-acetylmuramoyl-L-alanine amidase [Sporichthya sp.]MBA3742830.1 N-acetylmuramoyl-L-alanine amidase [Sporichthya sp.]
MRITPALLILTLAASTASVAAPVVGLPGGASAHAVEPKIVEISLAPAELTERALPAEVTGVRERLLSPANFTEAFSLIGLTWDKPTVEPVEHGFELSVRTRHDGAWTAWSALEADGDGPDGDADELAADPQTVAVEEREGTAPLWVPNSDAFQFRLDRLRGPAPTGLQAMLVDPGRSAADAAVGSVPRVASQAHATIAWPTVYRRKDWGAAEQLRNATPRFTGPIQAAFVHHTAGTNDYAPADVPKILRGVYAYHVKGRGWSDVGYNFLVDRFGRIWEGRAGGVDRTVLGAHTGGFNSDSFGVSVMGDYTKTEPSAETVAALARVIAWKFSLTGDGPSLDPLSIVELVSAGGGTSRYRSGTAVDFIRISGHTDAGKTECPGKYLYAQLPTIRSMVRQILSEESTYGPALPEGTSDGTEPPPTPTPGTAGETTPAPEEGGDDVTTSSTSSEASTAGKPDPS